MVQGLSVAMLHRSTQTQTSSPKFSQASGEMKIILNRAQARDILEWCKTAHAAETDEAIRLHQQSGMRAAKPFYRKAKTWRILSTQIKEGMKRESPKRKPKTNPNP
jgi:delta 1-pyrroline-5-carboxylate dehydrogenase